MKIYSMKINGAENPVGFSYTDLVCSWKVKEEKSKKQSYAKIEVSADSSFSSILYCREGETLSSVAVPLELGMEPYRRYYWRVKVTDEAGECTSSDTAFFETGKMGDGWTAQWIGTREEDKFHPRFSCHFQAGKNVERARLYICGLGLFEAYLNGKKAGEDYLSPFINDYNSCYQYMTYDVTKLLSKENEISVILGNGWYKGRLIGGRQEWFGNRFALIAELRMEYADGTVEVVKTDENWSYCGSVIEESDIYDGEVYNPFLWEGKENLQRMAVALDLDRNKLCERYSLPVKPMEEVKVQKIIHTPAAEAVLDFGQNFAGYVEIHTKLPRGAKVVLEFGEVLQQGNFYRENYRTAKARYVFTADGSTMLLRPYFTFYGFRYVRVTGWAGELNKEDFIGKAVYSYMDRTGYLETGNEKVNRLYQNSVWGQKSNFLDMPTDCPQRDERLGWTGDAQVFARTAGYHMDTRAFYDKYMRDLGYDQARHGGRIPYCLPNLDPDKTSSVWGDAATFIPDMLYEYYGDREALKRQYPVMKAWVDYIHGEDEAQGTHNLYDFGQHFGDWLALDGVTEQSVWGETDSYFIASLYYYASSEKTAEAAALLDKKTEAQYYRTLADNIRKQLLYTYVSPAGHLCVDTQTAYLLALRFGIYRIKKVLIEDLQKRIRKDCFRIRGGFVGATGMCTVLADHGMDKLAYDFLLNEKFPGWLYCVNLGATTIWERWNSLLEDGTISGNDMNSLNHYSYGAVVEFLYRHAAGIQPGAPGFTKAIIAPRPDRRLKWVKCCYDSAAGRYGSEWRLNTDGSLDVHVDIPFNATATLMLPYLEQGERILDAGSYDYHYQPNKSLLRKYDWDSRLGEIAEDPEACEIMIRFIPQIEEVLRQKKMEDMAIILRELDQLIFFKVETERVKEAYTALGELEEKLDIDSGYNFFGKTI